MPINALKTGDDLVIRVAYQLLNAQDPAFEFVLRGDDGTPYLQFTTADLGLPAESITRSNTMTVTLKSIPLNNTRLSMSLAIWKNGTTRLYYWRRGDPSVWIEGNGESIAKLIWKPEVALG
jgi:hypothetical protein